MPEDAILKTLNRAFSLVFDETIELTAGTTASHIEGWDSLNNIRVFLEIEKEFKIKFTLAEISDLKNVGDLISSIENKLNKAQR